MRYRISACPFHEVLLVVSLDGVEPAMLRCDPKQMYGMTRTLILCHIEKITFLQYNHIVKEGGVK